MQSATAPHELPLRDLVCDRLIGQAAGDPLEVARHAIEHGLAGIALDALERGRWVAPAEISEDLAARHAQERRWSVTLDLELHRISALAETRRGSGARLSPAIVLKGPAVASRYRDPTVRTYVDIDLLVPREELDAWLDLLSKAGYALPTPWETRSARRYHHEVRVRRDLDGRHIPCELHTALWMEPRARRLDHAALLPHSEPSPWPGVRWLRTPAQMLVLALHLLHHRPEHRRLIWVRDLLELGDELTIARARALAREHDLAWALEHALHLGERVTGAGRWKAAAPSPERFGLARMAEVPRPGFLYHLAMMRDLGAREAARYVVTVLDPRRFLDGDGRIDLAEVKAWASRVADSARYTPWRRAVRRERDEP